MLGAKWGFWIEGGGDKIGTMAVVWHKGVVVKNETLGGKFRRVGFQVDDPGWVHTPGQFVLMKVPDVLMKVNDYSLCSLPREGFFEILVDVTPAEAQPPKGSGSRYIKSLRPGERIEFTGPAGNFQCKDDGTGELWFVATGSGISSLWGMLRERLSLGKEEKLRLWWGLRHEEEIFWKKELEELVSSYPNFEYRWVVSQPGEGWKGEKGHVTERVLEAAGREKEKDFAVYLCGSDGMIKDIVSGLTAIGVLPERIHWEKYY